MSLMEEKITPDIVTEICGYIRVGADFSTACLVSGFLQEEIESLYQDAMSATDGALKEFADDIRKATAHFEVMQLMKINSEGGAKGAQWLLEKTLPGKWKNESCKTRQKKEAIAVGWDVDQSWSISESGQR